MILKEKIKKVVPDFLLSFYHYLLALAGDFLYCQPSKKLKVIGVTGTKGKSTVVEMTTKILEEAGYKVASISSIRFKINKKEWQNKLKMAMPGRFKLQRFLRKALSRGCQYVVLEVSSEGIKQHRHRFIDFDVAVFTNLSLEHIEAHGGIENYRQAKIDFFKKTKNIHIINLDDENVKYFVELPVEKEYGYTIENQQENLLNIIKCSSFSTDEKSIIFEINNVKFILNLLGKFNIYNALAAVSVALSQGISLKICKKALEKIKGIPGRMEIVVKESFVVIVDYAHTPDSLEKVYETLNDYRPEKSKMICVLGACGGGRDKWKRPVLGKIAAEHCDKIIITNEDPYDENPLKIMEEIESGFSQALNSKYQSLNKSQISNTKTKFQKISYEKILDRRTAIRNALKSAQANDIVIITGKGSEPWMCVKGGRRITWDDRQVVKEEFKKLELN